MVKKRYPGSKPSVKSLGHGHCLTYNRTTNLSAHTDDANLIAAAATRLYKQVQIEPLDLRYDSVKVDREVHLFLSFFPLFFLLLYFANFQRSWDSYVALDCQIAYHCATTKPIHHGQVKLQQFEYQCEHKLSSESEY
jgi:hypothetical protein